MWFVKYSLTWGGIGMIVMAAGILICDFYREMQYKRAVAASADGAKPPEPRVRWLASIALTLLAWGPVLLATGIAAATAA